MGVQKRKKMCNRIRKQDWQNSGFKFNTEQLSVEPKFSFYKEFKFFFSYLTMKQTKLFSNKKKQKNKNRWNYSRKWIPTQFQVCVRVYKGNRETSRMVIEKCVHRAKIFLFNNKSKYSCSFLFWTVRFHFSFFSFFFFLVVSFWREEINPALV